MGQIQNMDQVREEVECIRGWVTRMRMSVADGAPDTIVVPRTEYWMSGGGTTPPPPRVTKCHGCIPDTVSEVRTRHLLTALTLLEEWLESFRDDLGLAEQ